MKNKTMNKKVFKRQEKEKVVHEKDTPMVDMETLAQEEDYHFVEENTSDVDEPTVVENIKEESKEGEKNDREKDSNEKKEKKKEEDEENISVGDSLLDLEKQRKINKDEKKYEPITEPEGPPIDQSPVHVQRGLRGDYGGKDCQDENKNCPGWAKLGECQKNPLWMQVYCKKSCDVCSCSNNDIKCYQWAKTGECEKNSEWMKQNCMKSCELC
ncbi:protein Red-like [Xenia sp. Carnegie-2017]|uniref:protein Red-like n=1 Tax=Xenia sp. Carnegie-2017 TaxID=2897299 RepID=UPI001F04046E|nr:protein Red-like [Xenia sp. Carnegie-2017]